MAPFFSFIVVDSPLDESDQYLGKRHLVVFSTANEWSPSAIEIEIERHIVCQGVPSGEIILLGLDCHRDAIVQTAAELRKSDRLGLFNRRMPNMCVPLAFDANGNVIQLDLDQACLRPGFDEAIKAKGMRLLFDRYQARVTTRGTHHFQKPSGRHTNSFIRAGNILVSGNEVGFVACYLLSHIPEGLQYIYLDTGSIGWLGAELLRIYRLLSKCELSCSIQSYGSYKGAQKTRFTRKGSLFIISAATSGTLRSDLIRTHGIPAHNIVTLYYDGADRAEGGHSLSYPSQFEDADTPRLESNESYSADQCKWCQQGRKFWPITGDNFLPTSNFVTPIFLKKENTPKWLFDFQSRAFGKRLISAYTWCESKEEQFDLYVDFLRYLDDPNDELILKRKRNIFARMVPASLQHVVAVGENGAFEFAQQIAAYYQLVTSNESKVMAVASDEFLKTLGKESAEETISAVIAVSAVATGATLNKFCQSLRMYRRQLSLTFLIGISRTGSRSQRSEIRKNVTNSQSSDVSGYAEMEEITLPTSPTPDTSSWDQEIRFLESLPSPKTEFSNRLQMLNACREGSRSGLIDELYWRTPVNIEIKLNPDFVFLNPGLDANTITQSEVYFTITAILNEVRSSKKDDQTHLLLVPANFERFNDGAIQASLLRASKYGELDYSVEPEHSARMGGVIEAAINGADGSEGEALFEFFIAIVTSKLVLQYKHLSSIAKQAAQLCREKSSRAVFKTEVFKSWSAILSRFAEKMIGNSITP